MRKIFLLLLVAGTCASYAARRAVPCAAITALRGLVLPPPPRALVRQVLGGLVSGKPSGAAIAKLRRATWPDGLPLPRVRRSVGMWDGGYAELPSAPAITVRFPRELLGTAIEVATVMHEHEHARIAQALPQVHAGEQALRAQLNDFPFSRKALSRAVMVAEFDYLNEWHAMAAEYSIYRALTVKERKDLRETVENVPKDLDFWNKEILTAGLHVGYRTVQNYIRSQHLADRYNQYELLTDSLLILFGLRDEENLDAVADKVLELLGRQRALKAER